MMYNSSLIYRPVSPCRMLIAFDRFGTSAWIEFVTGIRPEGDQGGGLVRWQTSRTATTIYHETEPEYLQQFAEVAEQAEDGKGYLATLLVSSLQDSLALTSR